MSKTMKQVLTVVAAYSTGKGCSGIRCTEIATVLDNNGVDPKSRRNNTAFANLVDDGYVERVARNARGRGIGKVFYYKATPEGLEAAGV